MKHSRQVLGQWGEAQAEKYLAERGYTILARNTRTPYGELDLVSLHAGVLVFVEVKTRASTSLGWPEISITPRKRLHLLAAAQAYLQSHPEWEGDWRIDVISIQRLRGEPLQIAHFENAIT